MTCFGIPNFLLRALLVLEIPGIQQIDTDPSAGNRGGGSGYGRNRIPERESCMARRNGHNGGGPNGAEVSGDGRMRGHAGAHRRSLQRRSVLRHYVRCVVPCSFPSQEFYSFHTRSRPLYYLRLGLYQFAGYLESRARAKPVAESSVCRNMSSCDRSSNYGSAASPSRAAQAPLPSRWCPSARQCPRHTVPQVSCCG